MAGKHHFVVICILLAEICCVSLGFECYPAEGYEGCACYTNNTEKNNTKEYVNLLPLKMNFTAPRFTVKDKQNWYISYSPCGVFNMFVGENNTGLVYKPCVNASVARWTNGSTHECESLGNKANSEFASSVIGEDDDNIIANLTLKFKSSKTEHHSAVISLVCNDTLAENETMFEYINTVNMPTDTYYLALTSICCCPGKCGVPPAHISPLPTTSPTGKSSGSSGDSLKTWEIIVIVVACVILALLLIAGIVYCCKRKREYEAV